MAAPRKGDGGEQGGPKRSHNSRRSVSSSPGRASPAPVRPRSLSPRSKRLRRAQEEREQDRSRERDHGRNQDRDRDRNQDRGRVRHRDREDDDRMRSRDKDRGRERPRDGSREPERPRDRRGRDRPRDSSPKRSPMRSRHDPSPSRKDVLQRRASSPRTSPHHQRSSKNDKEITTGTTAAPRHEDDGDGGKGRDREFETPQQDDPVNRMNEIEAALEAKEKEKPSFEYSGKLAAETNKVKGVTLQFTEPPEARKPSTRWRLYVFKDGEPLNDPLYIHRQTCYLFGRERRVADVPTDHPSCSKQHAVIQYRFTEKEEASGMTSNKVRPYLMDLGSTNGTFLNGERLDPQRYYEMFEKDTIKFGNSSREYVLLHEHSAG